MARKSSPLEDVLFIASRIPWWLDLILALASYVIFSVLAAIKIPSPTDHPGLLFLKIISSFAQFLLPFIFILGAGISFYRTWKRQDLLQNNRNLSALNNLSWQDFELLVGQYFRTRGYTVTETRSGPDGGVDLIVRESGDTFLVQCKRWKATKVPVQVVRELYGLIAEQGAAGGYIVSTGRFTRDAAAFAHDKNISLIGGERLVELIGATSENEHRVSATQSWQSAGTQAQNSDPPLCPRCTSPMVKRVARRGANAGNEFWGCSKFPDCKCTVSTVQT